MSSSRRLLWAWQCSPTKNCVVLLQGFLIFSLFDFVSPLNLKTKPPSSAPDGVPVVSFIFSAREVLWSNLFHNAKRLCKTLVMKDIQGLSFTFFEVHKEHWKPMQGWKRHAKRQAKSAPDRAPEGVLEPHPQNLVLILIPKMKSDSGSDFTGPNQNLHF